MFGLFWLAKRATRRSTGGGCLMLIVGIAVIGGITGTQSSQAPTSGTYGYSQSPGGALKPSYDPGDGGGHYIGGPAWTPGPAIPAHIPPTPAPAPTAATAPVAAPTSGIGPLLTIGSAVAVIAILAILGSRMTPAPINTSPAKPSPPADGFYPCCGLRGGKHATTCPTHGEPPGDPQNPTKRSGRT
jgi:hypothetical protein